MKNVLKIIELLLLFVGVPLAFYFNLFPKYKILALLAGLIYCLVIMLTDKTFDRSLFQFNKTWWMQNRRKLFIRFAIISVSSIVLMYIFEREYFFFLIRKNVIVWVVIMCFYPMFSAIPQEIIYRMFFFYRYSGIFKSDIILIILNSFLFSIAHLMFNNYLAPVISLLGGLMFALTYRQSKSLAMVAAEHSLYGNWIFTVGVGKYFYVPVH